MGFYSVILVRTLGWEPMLSVIISSLNLSINENPKSPGWCGSMDRTLACQGTGLGCRPSPQLGRARGNHVSLTHWCFSPSRSASLSLSLKKEINKIFKGEKLDKEGVAPVAEGLWGSQGLACGDCKGTKVWREILYGISTFLDNETAQPMSQMNVSHFQRLKSGPKFTRESLETYPEGVIWVSRWH